MQDCVVIRRAVVLLCVLLAMSSGMSTGAHAGPLPLCQIFGGSRAAVAEGFERPSIKALTASGFWHFQITGAGGTTELVTEDVHSGTRALRMHAKPTLPGSTLTKLDLATNRTCFLQNDDMWFRGWFFFEDFGHGLTPVTIWDIEAPDYIYPTVSDLSPLSASQSVSPGRRLMVLPGNAVYMQSKASGAGLQDFRQTPPAKQLPIGRWVEIVVHMHIDGFGIFGGRTRVWQDGVKIIDAGGINFPYGGYAPYRSLQVGVSANERPYPVAITVDDIEISHTRPRGAPR